MIDGLEIMFFGYDCFGGVVWIDLELWCMFGIECFCFFLCNMWKKVGMYIDLYCYVGLFWIGLVNWFGFVCLDG